MFRSLIVASLAVLAACSTQPQAANQAEAVAPLATPSPPTADALAAKQVAERYFDLMRAGDFTRAWALWSVGPGPSTGGGKAFVAASQAQGRLDGHAGEPSAISETDGTRYILIESAARLTTPKGRVTDQAGVVMLRRPATDGAKWQIWGIDVRPRHCRKGQMAQGLGCVPA